MGKILEFACMKNIQPFIENPAFPFIVIDEFYDKKEEELIWQELEFYSGKYINADHDTTGNRSEDCETGKVHSSSNRIYLDQIYNQDSRYISNILNVYGKITSEDVMKVVRDNMPTAPILEMSNYDLSQISYYDSGDFYDDHVDFYGYTVLVWFFKEPKRFSGGDFMILGPNKLIECKHNRLVMIPSYYTHSVTPIIMEKIYRNKGLGRYTLTHFYFFNRVNLR
jgi:Rps23 Pro-64 3,4-dihydroxylase Tpa1-like proline 4-hydroxylase